jgi:hypothetical protein
MVRPVIRGRVALGLLALMTVAACGENHPSAESSDDTHSVVDAEARTSTTLSPNTHSAEPGEKDSDGVTDVIESDGDASETTIVNGVAVPVSVSATSSGSNAAAPSTPSAPTTPAPPATIMPAVIPCDAVPGASCAGADLRGQELMYANLQGADFRGAILVGVDLTGADLSGANFTNANLTNANLSETVLFGTDFTGVRLTRTNLQFVLWDDSTIWPSGFTPPDF